MTGSDCTEVRLSTEVTSLVRRERTRSYTLGKERGLRIFPYFPPVNSDSPKGDIVSSMNGTTLGWSRMWSEGVEPFQLRGSKRRRYATTPPPPPLIITEWKSHSVS